ncbi:gpW family head-tail joining protein [Brevundimonas sp.]|uniref:gpW family head-tail joining protein n=1 Tax=Brevundimonas sp. TaxID=1871086 RepID=UPI00289F8938|nr:gpW family head-tail joining protein [Brevundimonas sp.]
MTTLAQRLVEAEAAYHSLMTGRSAVTVTDQSGESITYGRARASDLAGYVANLKQQISGRPAIKTIRFNTSKGI